MTQKLEGAQLANLQTLVTLAQKCGMKSVLLSEGKVRALNDSKTCVLLSDASPVKTVDIGIGRLDALSSRLGAFSSKSDASIKLTPGSQGDISSMEMSAGRNKVQFRCTSVRMMNEGLPKRVPDAEAPVSNIVIELSEIKEIIDAIRVMGAKLVTLVVDTTDSARFIAMDESNDSFTVDLASPAEIVGDDAANACSYDVNVLVPVLKELSAADASRVTLSMGAKGTLTAVINQHSVIMLPQINTDGDD